MLILIIQSIICVSLFMYYYCVLRSSYAKTFQSQDLHAKKFQSSPLTSSPFSIYRKNPPTYRRLDN